MLVVREGLIVGQFNQMVLVIIQIHSSHMPRMLTIVTIKRRHV
ncbi:hypothetical protein Goari_017708 [Gossypium aridum]|uniref:Uncharacterized protein n=1 Tax=Gossypium aridum TaxID=34290 RepID=A0A7J8WNR0_GOSAI|nr:hypothetical protein [Gossypium aridum]